MTNVSNLSSRIFAAVGAFAITGTLLAVSFANPTTTAFAGILA